MTDLTIDAILAHQTTSPTPLPVEPPDWKPTLGREVTRVRTEHPLQARMAIPLDWMEPFSVARGRFSPEIDVGDFLWLKAEDGSLHPAEVVAENLQFLYVIARSSWTKSVNPNSAKLFEDPEGQVRGTLELLTPVASAAEGVIEKLESWARTSDIVVGTNLWVRQVFRNTHMNLQIAVDCFRGCPVGRAVVSGIGESNSASGEPIFVDAADMPSGLVWVPLDNTDFADALMGGHAQAFGAGTAPSARFAVYAPTQDADATLFHHFAGSEWPRGEMPISEWGFQETPFLGTLTLPKEGPRMSEVDGWYSAIRKPYAKYGAPVPINERRPFASNHNTRDPGTQAMFGGVVPFAFVDPELDPIERYQALRWNAQDELLRPVFFRDAQGEIQSAEFFRETLQRRPYRDDRFPNLPEFDPISKRNADESQHTSDTAAHTACALAFDFDLHEWLSATTRLDSNDARIERGWENPTPRGVGRPGLAMINQALLTTDVEDRSTAGRTCYRWFGIVSENWDGLEILKRFDYDWQNRRILPMQRLSHPNLSFTKDGKHFLGVSPYEETTVARALFAYGNLLRTIAGEGSETPAHVLAWFIARTVICTVYSDAGEARLPYVRAFNPSGDESKDGLHFAAKKGEFGVHGSDWGIQWSFSSVDVFLYVSRTIAAAHDPLASVFANWLDLSRGRMLLSADASDRSFWSQFAALPSKPLGALVKEPEGLDDPDFHVRGTVETATIFDGMLQKLEAQGDG